MIPTLLGITFMVFMLVAMAPGGIGAALRLQSGSADPTSAALQQAYLEDRYGLDDPVAVQYVRWLGRISPVKFGQRAQVSPIGERVTAPKEIRDPLVWRWLVDALPAPKPAAAVTFDASSSADQRNTAWSRSTDRFANARVGYVGSRAVFEQAVANYLIAIGRRDAVTIEQKVREGLIKDLAPDRTHEMWPEIEKRGRAMMAAYENAIQAHADKSAVFAAKPFPEAGLGIIPGVLHIDWPDFGRSFSRGRPVLDLIGQALPVTLLLNFIAFPIIYLIAIPTGMLAATRRGSWFDVGAGAMFVALWSFPIVLAGVLSVGFLASKQYLGWFPVSGLHESGSDAFTFLPSTDEAGRWHRGYVLDTLWHVCLPVMCIVYGGFAVLSKQCRAAMLDNFNADYVRTAKAKGVSGRDIVFRHVFRNSLLPLITIFVTIFPAMLSGSVVIERIFTIEGMGKLALDAINLRDREVILATTMMIAGVNLLALLLADILYAVADPRVSYS